MIIVQGVFTVAADERERFLDESLETQRISRGEAGCIEYVLAADPLDPERVVLSERWESQEDLDAHIEALTARRESEAGDEVKPLSRQFSIFEATEVKVM